MKIAGKKKNASFIVVAKYSEHLLDFMKPHAFCYIVFIRIKYFAIHCMSSVSFISFRQCMLCTSLCVFLHLATGKAVEECAANVNECDKKGQDETNKKKKKTSFKSKHVHKWRHFLTEHVQADFLRFLSCLVLGNASVISFIHLLDILYYQFRTILVQVVFVTRFKDNVVTVAEEKQKRQNSKGSHHKPSSTHLERATNRYFNLLDT